MYQIRLARMADLDVLGLLLENGKDSMVNQAVNQWTANYPTMTHIQKDVEANNSYVILKRETILGVVTYDQSPPIELRGKLVGKENYFLKRLVIHSSAQGLGLGKMLVDYCNRHVPQASAIIYSLTNHTNKSMQRLFERDRFKIVESIRLNDRLEMGDFYLYKKNIGGEKEMNKIVVLGSLNMDLVITADRLPKVGETMIGSEMNYMSGGKGANQAVAAARLGSCVTMLGKIGEDTFGEKLLKHLSEDNINIEGVVSEQNMFTGIASIYKLPEDNCITVISGANDLVDVSYVQDNVSSLSKGDIFITQLEIPLESALEGLKLAKKAGARTILNPAPYQDGLEQLLPYVDILTPNETEFADLIGDGTKILDSELEEKMLDFLQKFQTDVIVTRGSMGVSYTLENQVVTIPAMKVKVVDTTGAGDTFNGALASALVSGHTYSDAVKQASVAASMAVTKLGAQSAMPTAAELASISV